MPRQRTDTPADRPAGENPVDAGRPDPAAEPTRDDAPAGASELEFLRAENARLQAYRRNADELGRENRALAAQNQSFRDRLARKDAADDGAVEGYGLGTVEPEPLPPAPPKAELEYGDPAGRVLWRCHLEMRDGSGYVRDHSLPSRLVRTAAPSKDDAARAYMQSIGATDTTGRVVTVRVTDRAPESVAA